MATSVSRKKSNSSALEQTHDKRVRRITKWRLHHHFLYICQAWHGVQPAATDNSYLYLLQSESYLRVKRRTLHEATSINAKAAWLALVEQTRPHHA
jgi:hypothetical protein